MDCKPTSPTSALAMRKESHLVAKLQPKIRIVHIFAPEIIKTDAANFRELVQRLTGKPAQRKRGSSSKKKRKLTAVAAAAAVATSSDVSAESEGSEATCATFNRGNGLLLELERGATDDHELMGLSERVKEEEEEMWGGEHSGFFSGLGDFDGFIQGLSEFPVLAPLASSHLDVFGEAHLS